MKTILGNTKSNTLVGTSVDDLLAGLGGDDLLIGDLGNDTAWYSGLLANYQFGTDGAYLTIKDTLLTDGDDGLDRLSGVENLAFGNAGLTVTGGEFRVNTNTADLRIDSAVTALADGGFVVTWSSYGQDVSFYGIYAQRYDALGVAAGNEFKVNTYTFNDQNQSATTALADGGFVVTWTSFNQDNDANGIYAQRYDALGVAAGNEFRVNTYTTNFQSYSAVTALADGGFVVTWSSSGQDGGGKGIYAQRYDAQGVAAGGEFRVNNYPTGDQYDPAVTALADGGFVVTWTSDFQDGSSYGIYAQRYDAAGVAAGGEFKVNTYTTGVQEESAVTALADGGFVVTWSSFGQDGAGKGIYAQRYDAEGVAAGDEFRINSFTNNNQSFSAVTALADGGFVVTWTSSGQDGSNDGIYAQRYDAAGVAAGNEFRVNTYTTDHQSSSAVTALADGGFVVTWTSYGQDGSLRGIYAQRYDAEGVSLGIKLTGTAGADTLNLAYGAHMIIDGAGGNDVITGGSGDDILAGGLGTDTLSGGNGDDLLGGGAGNDTLTGGNGDDRLEGGAGSDTLIGGNGGDTYVVDVATDIIQESGLGGSDTVLASVSYTLGANLENLTLTGSANINATGNAQGNVIIGNSGNNTLNGGTGADLLAGGLGNDTYIVDNPYDIVTEEAGAGYDKVISSVNFSLGDNVDYLDLTGTALTGTGNELGNRIQGNASNNSLTGNGGDDTLLGGAGNDTVDGGYGDDWLYGDAGNDTVDGGDGNDRLVGDAGNDTLVGGNGNDRLIGGLGLDKLTGGAGNDIFIFDTAPGTANADHITDFDGMYDDIYLSQTVFKYFNGPGQVLDADFSTGTTFLATNPAHFLYNESTGALYYNADGKGAGALVLIATLDAHPDLAANDIYLA